MNHTRHPITLAAAVPGSARLPIRDTACNDISKCRRPPARVLACTQAEAGDSKGEQQK